MNFKSNFCDFDDKTLFGLPNIEYSEAQFQSRTSGVLFGSESEISII